MSAMERKEFCDRVLAKVRHATPEEKTAIRAELDAHMEDHAAALLEAGYEEAEATERAMAAMGDPEEIGAELNKDYPLGWLVLSRVSLILTVLICATVLFLWPVLGNTLSSFGARIYPEGSSFASQAVSGGKTEVWSVDLRASAGDDVVRVYKVALTPEPDGETGYVILYMCNYDRNPFGIASTQLIHYFGFESSLTSEDDFYGTGGGGNQGAYYSYFGKIPVSRTDTCVAVTYDGFGNHMRLEVPLDWGTTVK